MSTANSSSQQTQPFSKYVLSNGLTVVLVPMKGMKSATVLALVNVGSRNEPKEWGGISHFLEHMVFKGSANYETAQDLASAVDAVGAEYNAFTSKEYTGYYVHAASEQFPLALDVVSDMLLTPKLRTEDLERERGVIIEEINMYLDTPMRHIGDVFEEVLFAGSELGRDVIGTKETVRAIKREHFVEYVKQWYGLQNVVVTVAGDASLVESAGLLDKIEKAFSKTSDTSARTTQSFGPFNTFVMDGAGDDTWTVESKKAVIPSRPRGERIHVEYKKTDQAHFIFGVPGFARTDARRYALSVLTTLFGGTMSSRLFSEVREKRGLCYYVRSEMDLYHDTGIFGVSAGVDPSRIEEAVKVVLEEFHALVSDGKRAISEKEVQMAKDNVIGRTVLSMEDSESVANYYGMKQLLSGKIETPEEMLEKIKRVTLEDVQQVAKEVIEDAQIHATMIGPFKDDKPFEVMK